MIPIVILAGGLATRLRPITTNIPKSLLKVNGEPFIIHQLRNLKFHGFKNVIICIGHLGSKIKEVIQDGSKFGLNVFYSSENEKLLGTGGAILNAFSLLDDYFFIQYGDSWLEINYSKVYKKFINSNKTGLMTIHKNNDLWDKSNVEFVNNQIILYSKKKINNNMKYIDYGLGILSKKTFNNRLKGEVFDISEIYEELSIRKELIHYIAKKRFFEIGSYEGLVEIEKYFKERKI